MRQGFTAVAFLFAVAALQAEPVENPEFANWSQFKAGTVIVSKTVSQIKDIKSENKITMKLVEIGKDKLVIETEATSVINGMEFKSPGMKRDIPKTVDVPKSKEKEGGEKKPGKPEGTTEEGTETLKIGGTEVKTKWFKFKNKTAAGESSGQTWMSEEVPGRLVKMVVKAGDVSTTTEVVEIKKP